MTGREETTGIQTINDNRSFNAFMQGDEIIIAALNNDVLEGTINIYSLNGTLINSMVVNNSQVAISTAGYKSGIYIIEANQPQGKFVDKVFVLGNNWQTEHFKEPFRLKRFFCLFQLGL